MTNVLNRTQNVSLEKRKTKNASFASTQNVSIALESKRRINIDIEDVEIMFMNNHQKSSQKQN
jgi:hypothetical protein